MPTLKLTDAAVQRLKAAPGTRIEYFDALLPGFALRVSGPTKGAGEGRRSWVAFYRRGRRLRRLTIGTYPAFKLGEAREAAREALQAAARGEDPAAAKRAANSREPDTVESVIDEFMSRHMKGKLRSASYVVSTRRLFDNHVLPSWRGRDIKSIARRDVIELLDSIVDRLAAGKGGAKKGAKVLGGPIAANRVLAAVRKLFNWSLQRGLIESTPAALVERPGEETRRERSLLAEEIAELWPCFGDVPYPFGAFFKMLLVTGQRRSEVATMRWADLDEAERTWTIPSDQTKAGRGHAVPLSPLAVDIIAECRRESLATWKELGEFVFTTTNEGPISGFSKAKRRLDGLVAKARAKAKKNAGRTSKDDGSAGDALTPWTNHDLRRTVGTGLGRLGVSRLVIARVLNHADRSVTGIYDRHEYLDEKRHALEAWAAYLVNVISPAGENVVPMRGA